MSDESLLEEANSLYSEGKYSESLKGYISEAEKGNIGCMRRLGFMYYQGKGIARDINEAEFWFRKAYEYDDKQSSIGLIRIFIEKDNFEQALKYIREMASKEYPPAYYWFGRMCLNGFGLPKDTHEAFKYFSLAAKNGHFPSMRSKAQLLLKGEAGFIKRFAGLYELCWTFIVVTKALIKNPNDENQFF